MNNLLNIALQVIPKQSILWKKFVSTGEDDRGRSCAHYAEPVALQASVQPVTARDYQAYGLDLNRKYFTIWASAGMESVARNASPDRFTYAGMELEAVDNTDWLAHNGWRSILCVRL